MTRNHPGSQLLAQLRQDVGISQSELATRAGVSRSMIAQIEIGERSPSRKLLENLCRVMDVSTTEAGQLMLAFHFRPGGETHEQIEAVLRFDMTLSDDQVREIVANVREAYESNECGKF